MSNAPRILEYQGVRIEIQRATARIGTRRSVMAYRGAAQAAEDPEELAVLRTITYPDLVAPVISASGELETPAGLRVNFSEWPIPFEKFIELPDDFIWKWEAAVYETNPHWNPAGPGPAEAEEKKIEK